MNTKIKAIGFEIEGEWSSRLIDKLEEQNATLKSDASLNECSGCGNLRCIEYNSPVYLPTQLQKIKNFFVLLQEHYQNKEFHFNSSCGFHIHVSFEPKFPPEIFSAQFVDYFRELLKIKQKTVIRHRANNKFCRIELKEEEIYLNNSDRYKFINLFPSWSKHGTIEFRIFPANSPKAMYRYLIFTLAAIRNFLKKPLALNFDTEFELPSDQPELIQDITLSTKLKTPNNSDSLFSQSFIQGRPIFTMGF